MKRVPSSLVSVVACLAGVTFIPALALAQSEPASLAVTRDENSRDCPDSAALAAKVTAILGRPALEPGSERPTSTWVQVEITRNFESYRAHVQTLGKRTGSRLITDVGARCDDLAEALAVALAILLDEQPSAPISQQAPAAAPAVPPPPAPVTKPVVEPKPPPRGSLTLRAELSGGLGVAMLEDSVPLVEGSMLLVDDTFRLAAGGALLFPDTSKHAGGELELSLSYLDVRGCLSILAGEDSGIGLCGQGMLGSLHAEGSGFEQNSSETALWVALGAGLEGHGALSERLFWVARALALTPTVRPGASVSVDDRNEVVFRVPRIGGLFSLGFQYGS